MHRTCCHKPLWIIFYQSFPQIQRSKDFWASRRSLQFLKSRLIGILTGRWGGISAEKTRKMFNTTTHPFWRPPKSNGFFFAVFDWRKNKQFPDPPWRCKMKRIQVTNENGIATSMATYDFTWKVVKPSENLPREFKFSRLHVASWSNFSSGVANEARMSQPCRFR